MKRIMLFLIVTMFFSSAWAGKRALLVGISKYNNHTTYGWNNIHGAADVALLTPTLQKQGFQVTAITETNATRVGILAGLNNLVKSCKKGDIVYIHFSMHGQPVEDGLNGKGKDEADGWDEAIAPYDAKTELSAAYDGSKHITDDELNVYFRKIRSIIGPKGVLYVAMDACHAGNAEKDAAATVRGTNMGLSRTKKYNPVNADHIRHYVVERNAKWGQMLMLEACTSAQINREVRYQKKEQGALSTMIYLALQKQTLGNDPKDVYNAVYDQVQNSGLWPKRQNLAYETSY